MVVVVVVKWVEVVAMVALVEECALVAMVEQVCGGFGNYASCTGVVCCGNDGSGEVHWWHL